MDNNMEIINSNEVNYKLILNTLLHNINAINSTGIHELYASKIETAINDIMYFVSDDHDIIDTKTIEIHEENLCEKFHIISQRKDDNYYSLLKLLSYIDYAINVFKMRPYWVTAKIIKSLDDTILDVIARSRIETDITSAYIVKSIIKKVYMNPLTSTTIKIYTMFFIIGNMSRIRIIIHNTQVHENKNIGYANTARALIRARDILRQKRLIGIISGTGLL